MLPEGWPESSLGVEFYPDTPAAAAGGTVGWGQTQAPPFPGSLVDPMPNQAPHPLVLWGLAVLWYDILWPG